jgi:flavin reductase (DIM6/NTAB) family NADH-FMN oxidoreductase RutF
MLATGRGVLQLLGKQHAPLFHLLGKTSGRDVDKFKALMNHTTTTTTTTTTTIQWKGHTILEDCCGAMELVIVPGIGGPIECGDHDVVICDVTATYATDTVGILYTDHLRNLGYMASI